MTWGTFLPGALLFTAVWGGCAWTAWRLVTCCDPAAVGALRISAFGVVFTGLLIGVHLVPAAAGILGRGSALVATAVAALLASRVTPRPAIAEAVTPGPRASPAWSWVLVAAAGGCVVARLVGYEWSHLDMPPDGIDLLSFHLPDVARFIQTGSIWHNDQFAPLFANGNYPQSADFPFLAAILPFRQDFLVRLVVIPFWPLLGITLYALGREVRAPASTSALVALMVCSMPVIVEPTFAAIQVDVIMYANYAAGVLFLVRHQRTRADRDLVIAGLAFGIAFGSKWYGVTAVGVVVALWWAWRLVSIRDRAALAAGTRLSAMIAVVGGIWMVRNLVLTGSPVFPAPVRPLGFTLFDAPRDIIGERFGFSIADYLGDGAILRHVVVPDWWDAFASSGLLLAGAAVVAGGLALRARHSGYPPATLILALLVAAAAVGVVYLVTPNTALGLRGHPVLVEENSRYLVPAILLLVPCVAWLLGRAGRWRPLTEGVLALAVILSILHAKQIDPPPGDVARGLVVVLLLAGSVTLVLRTGARRVPASTAVVVLLVGPIAALAAGHRLAIREAAARYLGEPTLAALQQVPAGSRIGLAGSWTIVGLAPAYPAFGPRLRSHVEYVGHFEDGLLQDHEDRSGFVAALARGRYDLLLVGGADRIDGLALPFETWARDAGWTVAVRDRRSALLRAPSGTGATR